MSRPLANTLRKLALATGGFLLLASVLVVGPGQGQIGELRKLAEEAQEEREKVYIDEVRMAVVPEAAPDDRNTKSRRLNWFIVFP